jgi:hypothetical protein
MTDNSSTHYKELSLFNHIENVSHRAWNRLTTISNLKDKGRPHDAIGYMEKLNEGDKMAVGLLLLAIKNKGLDTVKAELNRGIG